jgi:RNA polymerase sigma-70 factor (sigma-E family)
VNVCVWSFDAFVADRSTVLLRTAYLLTGDRGYAEDLLQTALLRVFGHWSRARQAPEAYTRQVLVNLSRDRLRRMFRRPWEIALPADPQLLRGADCGIDRAIERRAMVGALAQLPVRQREVLVLRFFADLSVEQTATALGCSKGTVKSSTSRALARLRHVLAGHDNETEGVPHAH